MPSIRSISVAAEVTLSRAAMQALLAALGIALLLIAGASAQTDSGKAPVSLSIPFEYASDRPALLVRVTINGKRGLLLLDTGSAHTVVRPELVGIKRSELRPAHSAQSGAAFVGDAMGREVTLQISNRTWQKYRVVTMDLSQILSVYQGHLDGVLGLDFLQNYKRVTIDLRQQTIGLDNANGRTAGGEKLNGGEK